MTNVQRAPFGTSTWVEIVREEAAKLAAVSDAPTTRFVLVERYLNAPTFASPAQPLISGYRLEIKKGQVVMRYGVAAAETGDLTVELEYSVGARLCSLLSGQELEALSAAYRADGSIRSDGSADHSPILLAKLHDAVVARTSDA